MDTEQNPIHSGFGETTTAEEVIAGRDLTEKVVVVTGGHSEADRSWCADSPQR